MEKLMYLLQRPTTTSIEDFRGLLLNELIVELRGHGASHITIKVADLNDRLEAEAAGRLMSGQRSKLACRRCQRLSPAT